MTRPTNLRGGSQYSLLAQREKSTPEKVGEFIGTALAAVGIGLCILFVVALCLATLAGVIMGLIALAGVV